MTAEELMAAQRLVRRLPVGESVVEAILDLVRAARPGEGGDAGIANMLAWGPGPRAGQALMLAVPRARPASRAGSRPRSTTCVALAEPVLKHRMALTFAARAEGETIAGLIGRLVEQDRLRQDLMVRVRVLDQTERRPDLGRPPTRLDLARRLPRIASRRGASRPPSRTASTAAARPGPGETFWQFRPFTAGEPANRIDWRRSARDDRHYVREREWEAAHTIWLWIDRSAVHGLLPRRSPRRPKIERALVLGLALADLLVRGGERVGHVGLTRRSPRARSSTGWPRPSPPTRRRRSRPAALGSARRRSTRPC